MSASARTPPTPTSSPSSSGSSGLLSVEAALERMLTGLRPLPAEEVPLAEALGRVLAEPLTALTTLPPWDNTAMDGFAVRAADVADASPSHPVELRVIGEVAAGHAPTATVEPGTAIRILTGAMLPLGADAVVPVEDTDAQPGLADLPERVAVRFAVAVGESVRRAGSDIRAGDPLCPAGTLVRPATLALLAAAGHATVRAHRPPRVVVLATGDELAAPGTPLGPGQIPESNGPMLAAQARRLGAEVRTGPPAPDRLDAVLGALRGALVWADVVVASGGVSVGAHDVVRTAMESVARLDLWRVAVQPGKPLAFARATGEDGGGERLLFGLPGNPVSSFVTFELFVRPVLRALAGHARPVDRPQVRARLGAAVTKATGRRAYLRVTLRRDPRGDGMLEARLAGGQGSNVLSALAAADGLAIVPEGLAGLPAGAEVDVLPLDGG
ncbi:MAG TPA: gephyrin-like molybdotransferase Glp [Candidatus Limnocylindrales bacterium]|nr:gephyrin-like molybdotransferase Glp [Candidatus Limnocylindrales bacterium]